MTNIEKQILGVLCTVFLAVGCSKNSNTSTRASDEVNQPPRVEQQPTNTLVPTGRDTNDRAGYPAATDQSSVKKADNTGVNARDRAEDALTASDQGGSESDREISRTIRKGIMAKDDLSTTAKNIKIITQEGKVTLRGPVNTESEQKAIAEIAQGVAGVTSVDNQLEVKTNQ